MARVQAALDLDDTARVESAALDLLPSGIGIFDKDFTLIYANQSFRELRFLPERLCVPGTRLEDMSSRSMLPIFVLGLTLGAAIAASAAPLAQANAADAEPAVTSGDASAPEHLLGDWGGLRTDLLARGINLDIGYVSETAAVVAGGQRRGIDYAHSFDLKADLDMQRLVGLGAFSLHGAVVERAGRDASADFLHEYVNEVQEIYGGGGNVAAHLAYLYAEESLDGGGFRRRGGADGCRRRLRRIAALLPVHEPR